MLYRQSDRMVPDIIESFNSFQSAFFYFILSFIYYTFMTDITSLIKGFKRTGSYLFSLRYSGKLGKGK